MRLLWVFPMGWLGLYEFFFVFHVFFSICLVFCILNVFDVVFVLFSRFFLEFEKVLVVFCVP